MFYTHQHCKFVIITSAIACTIISPSLLSANAHAYTCQCIPHPCQSMPSGNRLQQYFPKTAVGNCPYQQMPIYSLPVPTTPTGNRLQHYFPKTAVGKCPCSALRQTTPITRHRPDLHFFRPCRFQNRPHTRSLIVFGDVFWLRVVSHCLAPHQTIPITRRGPNLHFFRQRRFQIRPHTHSLIVLGDVFWQRVVSRCLLRANRYPSLVTALTCISLDRVAFKTDRAHSDHPFLHALALPYRIALKNDRTHSDHPFLHALGRPDSVAFKSDRTLIR